MSAAGFLLEVLGHEVPNSVGDEARLLSGAMVLVELRDEMRAVRKILIAALTPK